MHNGNGTVEKAIQTMKNLLLANIEDGKNLSERINRALITIYNTYGTEKKTLFELPHCKKPRTELTIIIEDEKFSCQMVQNCPF